MPKFILPDAVPDQTHLLTLLRLAEAGYWTAFDQYLEREGVIVSNIATPDEIRQKFRVCVGDDRSYTCCLCDGDFKGWGNSPAPLVETDESRCCTKCCEDKVIPQRIRDATNAYAVITKK